MTQRRRRFPFTTGPSSASAIIVATRSHEAPASMSALIFGSMAGPRNEITADRKWLVSSRIRARSMIPGSKISISIRIAPRAAPATPVSMDCGGGSGSSLIPQIDALKDECKANRRRKYHGHREAVAW